MQDGHDIFNFLSLLQFVSYLFVTFIKAHRLRLAMVYFGYTVFLPLDVKSNNIISRLHEDLLLPLLHFKVKSGLLSTVVTFSKISFTLISTDLCIHT